MIYEQPEMEVTRFNAQVIVVVSGGGYDSGTGGGNGGGTEGDADGDWN